MLGPNKKKLETSKPKTNGMINTVIEKSTSTIYKR